MARNSSLLEALTEAQIRILEKYLIEIHFPAGEYIIQDEQRCKDLFIVIDGELEVVKKVKDIKEEIRLGRFENGDHFGEIALLDAMPRSATVRSVTNSRLFVLEPGEAQRLRQDAPDLYLRLMENFARHLGRHLRASNEKIVEHHRQQIEKDRTRKGLSRCFTYAVILFCLYTFSLKFILDAASHFYIGYVSGLILFFFVGVMTLMMKQSGYPMNSYGITARNWQRYLVEAILWTIPFLIVMTLFKWLWVHSQSPTMSVLYLDENIKEYKTATNVLSSMAMYVLLVPLQEFVNRGAIQGSLHLFLEGPRASMWAIFLSSLIYSMGHVHFSLTLAALNFLPGIFWGILFAKQRSLIGVTISHILIGWWAFYGLGIHQFF